MRPIVLTAVLIFAAAMPASASIAIFTDGRNMKIDSYRMLDDESMTLVMKGGGSMTLPITRIDRLATSWVFISSSTGELSTRRTCSGSRTAGCVTLRCRTRSRTSVAPCSSTHVA